MDLRNSKITPARIIGLFAKTNLHEPLTAKEHQVINAMVDGLSYKMIGGRLGISLETVRQHIKNIYRKLQVNSKVEVIARSIRGEL
jgi:DNA-binding CsgD family transcriptional regulator